jgi:hypothetical protein
MLKCLKTQEIQLNKNYNLVLVVIYFILISINDDYNNNYCRLSENSRRGGRWQM